VTERDPVQETAERNAHVRELVEWVRRDGDQAIESRDTDELVAVLRDTLTLLEAVAQDLIASRSDGAVEYVTNPEFRRLVDEIARAE
jgi:hypothetical protein